MHEAVRQAERRTTPGIEDIAAFHAAQVADLSHREVLGPLLPGNGASGAVSFRGRIATTWGESTRPEMCFSLTKTVLAVLAGVAFDRGMIPDADTPVADTADLPVRIGPRVTWTHLLQQTSGWAGELWGKPADVDAQSLRDGGSAAYAEPGVEWAYNDVRVNLLALALTVLWRRPLDDVARTELFGPLGFSDTWSWHGYRNSLVVVDGVELPVVSGGAHWGGGLWASAVDLVRLGELILARGSWYGERLVSPEWIDESWRPCPANPDYGFLWWLNDRRTVFPEAPSSGRCARGCGNRHLLWVDPDRELVVVSHWSDSAGSLVRDVSDAITV
ncbi:CubicO group peptidase (beta-lactamase class C family) [Prauserella isguenensis]|uniref:CubicO group peptidase (Beta-lactamase class C family) n=1 Tax=Prauserella isguenensis TaxID=1470180 RepID=A0A839S4B6_9PSEU|nr:serine hydrolase [Prauserella isguenensis]MBB3052222.1 CubicO group peptidase (beta-lactamase class C family) [Prauserella isguenensis]